MTFRQSLYISVFAHLLAFGSAIAFAQFAGVLILHFPDVVSVSLISEGVSNTSKTDIVRHQSIPDHSAPKVSGYQPAEQQKISSMDSHPVADDKNNEDRTVEKGGNNGGGEVQAAASNETGRNGSSSIGLIAPEQWAAIESAIRRNKNYPRIARERGIEGVVRLRFMLNPSGAVDKLEVLQSSGSDVLDNASIQAVYRAAPMPYVDGWVEIPIVYVLK